MRLRAMLMLAGACLLSGSLVAPASADPVLFGRFFDDDKPKKKKKSSKKSKKGKKGDKDKGPGPTRLNKRVRLSPKGVQWGMGLKELTKVYNKVFDDEFRPLYKRTQPGVKMQALDEELRVKKGLIKRNHLKFGNTPTGVDYSSLKGEYSYKNQESKTHITLRSGVKRHFFFFNNKLWKVYDEHKLKKKGALGRSYNGAVKKLTKKLKVLPRKREAGQGENAPRFNEADWADGTTVVRLVDRSFEKVVGLVYVDQSVWENLDRYRPNKMKDASAVDADVESITRGAGGDEKDGDKKKKKK